jgi:hypothetical protein
MDEIHVASPRLVNALVEGKPLDETRNVDNVLSSETRVAKTQPGKMGFDGGFFGTTGVGVPSGSSGGIALGLLYRAGSLGISSSGRAGGIGSGERSLSSASLDIGARYYVSTADTSPFVGGGLGISHFEVERKDGPDLGGSGFGAHVQLGVEVLRTHAAGFSIAARADLPFFALADGAENNARYVVPLSFNVGMQFH